MSALQEQIRLGDQVEIQWKRNKNDVGTEGFNNGGTVVAVTPRLIRIQNDRGYTFSVSISDLISGTKLTVIKRGEEKQVVTEYETLDKQADQETNTVTDFSVPEGMNWQDVLTKEKYLELKAAGWSDRKICKACGIHEPTLYPWKREQGLMGVKLRGGVVTPEDETAAQPSADLSPEPVPSESHSCNCGGTCGDQCQYAGDTADKASGAISNAASSAQAANQLQAQADALSTTPEWAPGDKCELTQTEPALLAALVDDFVWYGAEVRGRGAKDSFISISAHEIRISAAASVKAQFRAGEMVQVGVGDGKLAIRRAKRGIPLICRNNKMSKSVQLSASVIVKMLKELGWPIPCSMDAEWNPETGILIGTLDREEVI